MSIIEAIILGLIQGLTEFIPVSSSGHLVLLHHIFGSETGGLAYDVALHAGTLAALVLYFWRDLWGYFMGLFTKTDKSRLSWILVMATVPAAVFGFLLESSAESTFRSTTLVSINLLVVGLLMLLAEYVYKKNANHTELEKITTKQGLIMGFAQALAIIPGISRSGSTITAGLFAGIDRVAATRFSFLLGIPITAGAILKVMADSTTLKEVSNQPSLFAIGIITALISGTIAIKFMLKFLAGHGLHIFAYYRIALALIVLIFMAV